MRVIVVPDYRTLSSLAADEIGAFVHTAPEGVLGLATGGTPEGLYAEMARRVAGGTVELGGVSTFNLDEYLGLAPEHPASYWSYMRRHLFNHVRVRTYQIPVGNAPDPEAECCRYEEEIARAGGIGLQVLGIGRNGHIGFNEPGSPLGGSTRVVELAAETVAANARYFADPAEVPRFAISMGIRTIMRARSILLLASGREKAHMVQAAVEGPVTPAVPASVLQLHPSVTLIADSAAASGLKPSNTLYRAAGA